MKIAVKRAPHEVSAAPSMLSTFRKIELTRAETAKTRSPEIGICETLDPLWKSTRGSGKVQP